MHVIAVANQKGGVAKTTTALSVAASLAREGRRVLALDLDPQGNLGMGAGLPPDLPPPSLAEVLGTRLGLVEAARPVPWRELATLSVVAAGTRLSQAEAELYGQPGFDQVLERKLEAAGSAWEVAVLDCPPSLGPLTVNALGAADLVLTPVQCEFFSARGVARLLDVIELVRERRNPELELRLVPVLFDPRNRIMKLVLEELRAQFGEQVSPVCVGVDTRVRESQAQGKPLAVAAPRSRAGEAYAALGREVLALCEERRTRGQAA